MHSTDARSLERWFGRWFDVHPHLYAGYVVRCVALDGSYTHGGTFDSTYDLSVADTDRFNFNNVPVQREHAPGAIGRVLWAYHDHVEGGVNVGVVFALDEAVDTDVYRELSLCTDNTDINEKRVLEVSVVKNGRRTGCVFKKLRGFSECAEFVSDRNLSCRRQNRTVVMASASECPVPEDVPKTEEVGDAPPSAAVDPPSEAVPSSSDPPVDELADLKRLLVQQQEQMAQMRAVPPSPHVTHQQWQDVQAQIEQQRAHMQQVQRQHLVQQQETQKAIEAQQQETQKAIQAQQQEMQKAIQAQMDEHVQQKKAYDEFVLDSFKDPVQRQLVQYIQKDGSIAVGEGLQRIRDIGKNDAKSSAPDAAPASVERMVNAAVHRKRQASSHAHVEAPPKRPHHAPRADDDDGPHADAPAAVQAHTDSSSVPIFGGFPHEYIDSHVRGDAREHAIVALNAMAASKLLGSSSNDERLHSDASMYTAKLQNLNGDPSRDHPLTYDHDARTWYNRGLVTAGGHGTKRLVRASAEEDRAWDPPSMPRIDDIQAFEIK